MAKTDATTTLLQRLTGRVVGQDDAWRAIVPFVAQYQAGLSPAGRPAGIFLLLGPTGTGKTSSVEALAEELHGSANRLVRINCAEFQSDHEIAKLIGAPPGYVGHRDTDPFITPQTLSDATSANCALSLVLFDEIEKAAPSLAPLMLAICDQGILRLGDGTTVDFSRSLIFLTSNLGAREMVNALAPRLGFDARPAAQAEPDLRRIGLAAVRARFSPEFVNRLDAVITYKPLDGEALDLILSHQIEGLRRHVSDRLGARAFDIEVTRDARRFLLDAGTSAAYGARELKRTVQRHVMQPIAASVVNRQVGAGATVRVGLDESGAGLTFSTIGGAEVDLEVEAGPTPAALVVADDGKFAEWLTGVLISAGYRVTTAATQAEARSAAAAGRPDAALIDTELADGDGAQLALELLIGSAIRKVVLMSAPHDGRHLRRHAGVPLLRKPFLRQDVLATLASVQEAAARPRR